MKQNVVKNIASAVINAFLYAATVVVVIEGYQRITYRIWCFRNKKIKKSHL